jgi:hypothetical protein
VQAGVSGVMLSVNNLCKQTETASHSGGNRGITICFFDGAGKERQLLLLYVPLSKSQPRVTN